MKEMLMVVFLVMFGFASYGVERAIYCAAGVTGACDRAIEYFGAPQ